jgi:hypothetical protein
LGEPVYWDGGHSRKKLKEQINMDTQLRVCQKLVKNFLWLFGDIDKLLVQRKQFQSLVEKVELRAYQKMIILFQI